MAATGTGLFAAGTFPSIHRRSVTGKLRSIPKSCLSVSTSAVPTERSTVAGTENGVVLSSSRRAGGVEAEPKDGRLTLRDYFDQCRDLISRSDGGPPRWFSPLECASQGKDSPLLLYLPGVDGVGLGLVLHHERLSKIFDIWCMHIPLTDRTSFPDLVKFVENAVRMQYSRAPTRPIYLVGESFGGCLALAVAARNPDVDLMLILANPATSFGRSLVQPDTLLSLSAFLPDQISSSLPYVLTLLLGSPVKVVASAMGKGVPSDQAIKEISEDTTAMSSYLSVLSKAFTAETLRWKLDMLKSAAAFTNSRLHAVKAQTLILASGQDQLLPSRDESERLCKALPKCQIRVFDDNGHALFLEDGISFLSILTGASFYRRNGRHDCVSDYFPPTPSEFKKVYEPQKWITDVMSPVVLSNLPDGRIERSLAGIPSEGPVLYVGYHMMLGLELVPLVSQFWMERNILLRGMAHPMMFNKIKEETRLPALLSFHTFRIMGAVPVRKFIFPI